MRDVDDIKRLLSEGRMGRREFMRRASAMGMAAAIPALVHAEKAMAEAPKRGGRLRQALRGGNTADTLFGVLGGGDTHQVNCQRQLLNHLTEVVPGGELAGELAVSWEASPDARKWTFELRQGVEFHNGKSFEAEDVIDSINVHRGPDSKSTGAGLVAGVDDIRADGKHRVIFTLSSGNADFPYVLSDYHFPIAPAGTTEADWVKGIGTGPFVLDSWDPGVRAFTRRNPNYFKEGKPYFDEVETIHITDVTARINSLQAGEVDIIDDPELRTLARLSRRPGIAVREAEGNKHYTFPMLMDTAPFDDPDVRAAVKYAMDREAILKTILAGHGYLGNDHPISKALRFHASELPQRSYDPDRSKFHLKKAGHSNLDLVLSAGDIYPGGIDAAVLFREHAAKAGINIDIELVSTDGYWTDVWNVKPFCVSFWNGRTTEDLMLTTAFYSGSAWNETHWKHERFDALLIQARAELDDARRREIYVELQRIIHDEGGLLCPVFANNIVAYSDKLHVPEQITASYAVDGCRNHERWWFT